MTMRVSPRRYGNIVALEGPDDLVSTQLRLLPASHQILVLPGLENYMAAPDPDAAAPLGVCELIRQQHDAYQARHAEALEFLRPSTPTGETRLVFLHGGAMSAHVACLSTIMEHETEGDIEEAHATYIRLANTGVAGLSSARLSRPPSLVPPFAAPEEDEGESEDQDDEDENPTPEPAIEEQSPLQNYVWGGHADADADVNPADDTMGDRIIRAMRAADALDKETEFLQPVTPDIDLTVKLVDIPSRSRKRLSPTASAAASPETPRPFLPRSPRDLHESHPMETVRRVSPVGATEQSASAAPRKPPLRIQIPFPPTPKPTPWAAAGEEEQQQQQQPTLSSFSYPQGPGHKRSRTADSCLSPTQLPETDDFPEQDSAEDAPLLPAEPRECPATEPPTIHTTAAPDDGEPVEEILPVREDFVVYFTPETPCELQEFVFRRLSEGCAKTPRMSVSAPPPPPPPPSVVQWRDSFRAGETSQLMLEDGPEGEEGDDEARTEDGDGNGAVTPWVRQDLVHGLPTPNHSPTPFQEGEAEPVPRETRLYSIDVGEETAVCIQNFLRPFLATLFPLQATRFSTADGAEFPGESSLWKVLECDDQIANANGEARLDLILAVGAESGVKKNRLAEIVGQLDQLGFKTSGLSRSGRLDIRFLIANAMQAFTAQPLTKQTQSNPFVNRALLAALIIPHLETYLSTHPDVRFLLIEYPSEHLPTVLALQTLIGTEMMKVVGIINSDAPPRSSLAVPEMERRPSEGFRSLSRRGSRKSGTFTGPCSFSKGNFLLASSATGFETAAFVAAIRESLISISDFYIPDRPLYRHPAPLLPPKKPYPALTVNTESTDKQKSRQEQDQSTSTLLITPPSSPTESSAPSHAHPRNTIPPRSSSFSASTFAGGRPNLTDDTPPTASGSRIRWGEVNYAPSVSTTASSTITSSTVATSTTASSASTDKITTTVLTVPGGRRGHVKKDSDQLSPGAAPPQASYASFSSSKSAGSPYPPKPPSSSASSSSSLSAPLVPATPAPRASEYAANSAAKLSSSRTMTPPLPSRAALPAPTQITIHPAVHTTPTPMVHVHSPASAPAPAQASVSVSSAPAAVAPPSTASAWSDDYYDLSDEDEHVPDADERRLMPMYLMRRRMAERGGGGKAMRWLGLV